MKKLNSIKKYKERYLHRHSDKLTKDIPKNHSQSKKLGTSNVGKTSKLVQPNLHQGTMLFLLS